jgi:SulP family sulfate permease
LRADVVAGLTVAVVAVPQSMAYALIAGLPVQYGLYASIIPTIAACLWGSSSHLITGPTTTVSLVVFTTLAGLAQVGTPHYLELAFLLALIVGAIQIGMALARLGVFLNFVSHSVILGYTAGAAVLIGFKQFPNLCGLKLDRTGSFIGSLQGIFTHLHETQLIALGLGLLTILIIVVLRKSRPALPGTLIAMLTVGGLVAAFDLNSHGIQVVGAIPRSLPPFHVPNVTLYESHRQLVPGALAIAMLGLVEAMSIAKAIAGQTRQRLNINQEFMALRVGQRVLGVLQRISRQRIVHPFGGEFSRGCEKSHERHHFKHCCGSHGAPCGASGLESPGCCAIRGAPGGRSRNDPR